MINDTTNAPVIVNVGSSDSTNDAPWWAKWGIGLIILILLVFTVVAYFVYTYLDDYCQTEYGLGVGATCLAEGLTDIVRDVLSTLWGATFGSLFGWFFGKGDEVPNDPTDIGGASQGSTGGSNPMDAAPILPLQWWNPVSWAWYAYKYIRYGS